MFDLIIIGGGPGGYHLATEAGKAGFKTAIIEEARMGGTCLNTGCIPSKAFLHIEKVVVEANHSMDIGVVGKPLSIDQAKVVKFKNKKIDFLVSGIEAKVNAAKAKIYKGNGQIVGQCLETKAFQVEVNGEILETSNLVIATGSSVFIPQFIKGAKDGYKKGYVITSTEALDLTKIPKKLIVVGGGIIGLELGSYYASAGSKVTIIEAGPKIAGRTDSEITIEFQKALESKGITFILNAKASEITDKEVIYVDATGKENKITHDKVLVAIGRKANTACGLEKINVFVENNFVQIDDKCQTNIPGVYAIGDVTGKLMLAHTASKHAEIVVDNLLGKNVSIDYNKIPTVIYGIPEIAEIGITEEKAKEEGIGVIIKKLSMLYSGKFVIENTKYAGLFKVIMKKNTQEIIGMSIFGNSASELIHMGSIIIGKRFSKDQIRSLIFAHPTIGEIIKDVIFN